MKLPDLNSAQREGLAKVADNLATAISIAVIVNGILDNKIGWIATVASGFVVVMLLFIAVLLRKEMGNDD